MGSWSSTLSTSLQHEPVDIHIKVLHNYGEAVLTVRGSFTVNYIKRQLSTHRHFQYSTRMGGNDDKLIIKSKVSPNHSQINAFLKGNINSIRSLNAILMHKVGGNWVRYKCINCGYIGCLEYYQLKQIPSMIPCSKCHYQLPSPSDLDIINTSCSGSKYTLQQLLHETKHILPTLLHQLKQLNIPTNVTQCIIGYCICDIRRITENGEIELCHRNMYHYSLIYNPFKPYRYEWIPTTVYKYDCDNEDMIVSHSDIGEIHTNYQYEYSTSEWMNHNCSFDDNERFAIVESEKECKIWIGCEQLYFDKEIYCNYNERNWLQKQKDKVQFEVKTLTGTTLTVCLGVNETVLCLKQYVLDHLGIPLEQQRWISPYGRCMEDHKTLKYYGVSCGSPVRLVLRLRG